MAQETGGQLEQECRSAMEGVRGALINLYSSIESDPSTPQVAAKRFGLNKNLAWKFSKIISAEDPFTAIQHLPGDSGVEIFLSTLESHGAPRQAVSDVRRALATFGHVIEVHASGRDDLDLMLDSMGLGAPERQLEQSRELAFRGNSGIFGLQAKVRLSTAFLMPSSAGPGLADSVLIGGFVGLRRLRSNVRWPLFRFQAYEGSESSGLSTKKLAGLNGDAPRILSEFGSTLQPPIEAVTSDRWTEHFLTGGEVGNRGAFDCFYTSMWRGFPIYRTPTDTYGEYASTITLPIEHLVFDVLYHKSLAVPTPSLLVFSRPGGGLHDPAERREENVLPIQQRVTPLAGSPPAVATPLVPRYGELVSSVYARLGAIPSDFRGYRLMLRWPPMPSTVALRWPLPERGA